MELHSKIAIITGASRGLGRATAEALVQKGTRVYGLGRNKGSLDDIATQLGKTFVPVPLDITDTKAVQAWIDQTFPLENTPHILINNAGAGTFGEIDELPMEKWNQMMATNLHGSYHLIRGIVPLMKAGTGGHIINIGSILGKTTNGGKSAYSATKYAMQGLSEALFKELRGFKIKVSLVNPGSIATDFFADSGIVQDEGMLRPEEVADTLVHILQTPDNVLIDELTLRPLNPKR